ncbi:hypothetical protein GCM10010169_35420 [Micromonospora fulviviridis]|nr:hypothetical protein GCM10010169_35420 [Micromonospora fulviviridis]
MVDVQPQADEPPLERSAISSGRMLLVCGHAVLGVRENSSPSRRGDESLKGGRRHGAGVGDLGGMRVHARLRWAYGTVAWLMFFVVSHVVAVLFPVTIRPATDRGA